MSLRSDIKILDCTIRDGGYINDWKFDKKMVRELYRNVSKAGVDFIELGFKNVPDKKDQGLWYSVSDSLLSSVLDGIEGSGIVLMADVGRVDLDSIGPASESRVTLYRIATHKDKLPLAFELCEEIYQRGYLVSLQLMGIISYTEQELLTATEIIKQSNIEYVYFADSYGSMIPSEIAHYYNVLKQSKKQVGFHAHNNLQLAFANTLEAIKNGVDIVDATILGMGRGAGNVQLEVLLSYLEKVTNNSSYNSLPVLDLADRYFCALMKEFNWGYQLPYMLSGIFKVHPTYAKHLVQMHEYRMEDMVRALEDIREKEPVGFKKDILDEVIREKLVVQRIGPKDIGQVEIIAEKKDYLFRHKDRDFLILATGPSLKSSHKDLDVFIDRHDPVVIGTNYIEGLFKPHYHLFSNKRRFISYFDQVDNGSNLIVSSSFDDDFIREYSSRSFEKIYHIYDKNIFDIQDGVLKGDFRTVALLAVGTAVAMGAKRVFIAGMDGYITGSSNDSKNELHFYSEPEEAEQEDVLKDKHELNEQMLEKINNYLKAQDKDGLCILTPTSYECFYDCVGDWIK